MTPQQVPGYALMGASENESKAHHDGRVARSEINEGLQDVQLLFPSREQVCKSRLQLGGFGDRFGIPKLHKPEQTT